MPKPKRKQRVVRVLERSVELAVSAAGSRASTSTKAGKLAASLRADVDLLKDLASHDKDGRFYSVAQEVAVKLVKLTRKLNR